MGISKSLARHGEVLITNASPQVLLFHITFCPHPDLTYEVSKKPIKDDIIY
jgi:hypothetical protein